MHQKTEVSQFLAQQCSVRVPDDWLDACIEWIITENQGGSIASRELSELVYEQWLVSDLRELALACLPPGVATEEKYTLDGKFCLQVDTMIDVSLPYYGQLQKIQGTENENAQVSASMATQPVGNEKASRMLMLKMTDGVTDVQGMEYEFISGLNARINPGTKVLIIGPVLCRRGVLMLRRENIQVLGGEVDSLLEINTPEQLLQSALEGNRDFSSRPAGKKTKFDTVPRQAFVRTEMQAPPSQLDQSWQAHVPPRAISARSTTGGTDINDEEMIAMMDDEFLDQIPTEQLDAMEQQWQDDDIDEGVLLEHMDFQDAPPQRAPSPAPKPVVTHQRAAIADYQVKNTACLKEKTSSNTGSAAPNSRNIAEDTNACSGNARKKPRLSTHSATVGSNNISLVSNSTWTSAASSAHVSHQSILPTNSAFSTQTSQRDSALGNSSITFGVSTQESISQRQAMPQNTVSSTGASMDRYRSQLPTQNVKAQKQKLGIEAEPYTYLNIIAKSWPPPAPLLAKVKAYISTLMSKLESNGGSHWSLTVKINDGTLAMDVDLDNKVLEELIGFSAMESMTLKEASKQDKNAKMRMIQGIKSCQMRIIQWTGILHMLLCRDHRRPLIKKLCAITEDDCSALLARASLWT